MQVKFLSQTALPCRKIASQNASICVATFLNMHVDFCGQQSIEREKYGFQNRTPWEDGIVSAFRCYTYISRDVSASEPWFNGDLAVCFFPAPFGSKVRVMNGLAEESYSKLFWSEYPLSYRVTAQDRTAEGIDEWFYDSFGQIHEANYFTRWHFITVVFDPLWLAHWLEFAKESKCSSLRSKTADGWIWTWGEVSPTMCWWFP